MSAGCSTVPMNDPHEKIATAFHEAGHAVIGWLHSVYFFEVTLEPDADSNGHVEFQGIYFWTKAWETRRLEASAYAACGGPVAEAIYLGMTDPQGVTLEAGHLFSPSDIELLMSDRISRGFAGFITHHPKVLLVFKEMNRPDMWSAVTALAEALLERKTLNHHQASRIIKKHIPVKWPGKRRLQ